LIFTLITNINSYSQDFVYSPVSPAFGGSYLNYSWLLSSAQAQNVLETEANADQQTSTQADPLQQFADNLNRQILNSLTSQLLGNEFGFEELKDGTYTLGDYQIEVSTGSDGIHLILTDFVNGGQTSITIPNF